MNTAPIVDLTAMTHVALGRILETGDVIGRDESGRTVIAVAVEDWMCDWLMAHGADTEDLEPDDECG
jgi:hypothetical protein